MTSIRESKKYTWLVNTKYWYIHSTIVRLLCNCCSNMLHISFSISFIEAAKTPSVIYWYHWHFIFVLPSTSRSKSRSAIPASFLAMHVYRPVSDTSELWISNCRPSESMRYLELESSKGWPLNSHWILGEDIPCTSQLMVMERPTMTWGFDEVLVVMSIIGGTIKQVLLSTKQV